MDRLAEVPLFSTVIWQFATIAPDASCTVPSIEPNVDCPNAEPPVSITITAAISPTRKLRAVIKTFAERSERFILSNSNRRESLTPNSVISEHWRFRMATLPCDHRVELPQNLWRQHCGPRQRAAHGAAMCMSSLRHMAGLSQAEGYWTSIRAMTISYRCHAIYSKMITVIGYCLRSCRSRIYARNGMIVGCSGGDKHAQVRSL